jgi:hypothetical protein
VHSENYTGQLQPYQDVNGMFGAGDNYANSAFWFNAESAWIGCENPGPGLTLLTVSGYRFISEAQGTGLKVRQNFYQPPCAAQKNCPLLPLDFGPNFTNLSALQIEATLHGSSVPVTWYMDDLQLTWSNNSCEAIQERDNLPGGH